MRLVAKPSRKRCAIACLVPLAIMVEWRPALAADLGRLNSAISRLASNPNDGGAKKDIDEICLRSGRPGAEAERAAVCTTILAKFGPRTPADARAWLLRQLERVGGAEVVGGLAQLLNDRDARIRECARRALEANPSPHAGRALRKALARAKAPEWQAALINALGARRDDESVGDLVKLLKKSDKKSDETVTVAAAAALGRIGGPEAARALASARTKRSPAFRRAATDAYLSCADRFLAEGYYTEAAAIYKKLYSPKEPNLVRIAAMQGIVAAKTAAASGKAAKRLARRASSSGRRVASAKPKKPSVDAEVVKAWDARLQARVEETVKAGRRLDFFLQSMRTRVKVVGVDFDGTLKVSSRGMQLGLTMPRLKMADKKNLAAAVAGSDEGAHAIAAFYCLASGAKTEAGFHLRKAGAAGGEVRKAFE